MTLPIPKIKDFARLFAGIACVLVCGYTLLFAVSLLPQEALRNNLAQADARGFFSEDYPQYEWLRPLFNRLDMYTECLGLGIALSLGPDARTLLETPTFGACPDLHRHIAVDAFAGTPRAYMRHTHGYQIVLKGMYTLFSLETARAVTAAASLSLLCLLFFALRDRTGLPCAAVVVCSFFLTASPNMFFTVTHAVQFWVALAAALAATLARGREMPLALFGVIGALDGFFSFLTMGSLSLALPLLCHTLVRRAEGESPERIVAAVFWGGLGWSFGFLLPWLVKWGALFLLFAPSKAALFGDTLERYPVQGLGMIAAAICNNFLNANWPAIVLAAVLSVRHRRRLSLKTPPGLWAACLPGLIPLLWIGILPGQSGVKHSTFVNLILWPFLAASLLLLLAVPSTPRADAPRPEDAPE
jgi:hypothetical protein